MLAVYNVANTVKYKLTRYLGFLEVLLSRLAYEILPGLDAAAHRAREKTCRGWRPRDPRVNIRRRYRTNWANLGRVIPIYDNSAEGARYRFCFRTWRQARLCSMRRWIAFRSGPSRCWRRLFGMIVRCNQSTSSSAGWLVPKLHLSQRCD